MKKYNVEVSRRFEGNYDYIGRVVGNTIAEVNENAKTIANNQYKDGCRLYLVCEYTNKEWAINN